MISRVKCSECGAQFSSDDSKVSEAQLTSHVAREHSSLEKKHSDVLNASRDLLGRLAAGEHVAPKAAREAYNQISDLLAKPRLAVVPATDEKEGDHAKSVGSVSPASGVSETGSAETVPGAESAVPDGQQIVSGGDTGA